MPIEYGVMLILVAIFLAGAVYAKWVSQQGEKRPQEKLDNEFQKDVLEQLRRVKETGKSVVLRERGWPTVEIRPEKSPDPDARENLRGSVLRYDHPIDPTGD